MLIVQSFSVHEGEHSGKELREGLFSAQIQALTMLAFESGRGGIFGLLRPASPSECIAVDDPLGPTAIHGGGPSFI
jgi:hypothetical protein